MPQELAGGPGILFVFDRPGEAHCRIQLKPFL